MSAIELESVNGNYKFSCTLSRQTCLITTIALGVLAWGFAHYYAPMTSRLIIPLLGICAIGYIIHNMMRGTSRSMEDEHHKPVSTQRPEHTAPSKKTDEQAPDRRDANRFGSRAGSTRAGATMNDGRPHDRSDGNRFGNRNKQR